MEVFGYDLENMSREEVGEKVRDDLLFSILFFVDNNPARFMEEAMAKGYEGVSPAVDPTELTQWLYDLVNDEPEEAAEIFATVPYDVDAANWTGDVPLPPGAYVNEARSVVPENKLPSAGMQLFESGGSGDGSGSGSGDGSGDGTGGMDWGGIGETAGAVGQALCGFIDDCDSSVYSGGQQQQPQPQQRSGMPWWGWLLIAGGVVGLIFVVSNATSK